MTEELDRQEHAAGASSGLDSQTDIELAARLKDGYTVGS